MMKRKAWQIAVLTLLIGVLLLLSACGKPKGEYQFSSSSTETGAEEVPAAAEIPLAGEY